MVFGVPGDQTPWYFGVPRDQTPQYYSVPRGRNQYKEGHFDHNLARSIIIYNLM